MPYTSLSMTIGHKCQVKVYFLLCISVIILEDIKFFIMAKPPRKVDGHLPRKQKLDLDMFWREYESIEPRPEDQSNDEDDDHLTNGNLKCSI